MKDVIYESLVQLREVNQEPETISDNSDVKKKESDKVTTRAFHDLWDQVYCSLTDGGAQSAYDALGKYNGKSHYGIYQIGKGGVEGDNYTITVRTKKPEWAETIADLYKLESKTYPDRVVIQIPKKAPIRQDIIDKYGVKNQATANESLNEDLTSENFPVKVLNKDEVKSYIENIPVATSTKPPKFFKVGYARNLKGEIASKYRGGRGSEGNPKVEIVKCSEYGQVYTGADYENLKATKAMRKATGKERTGDRTGFSYNSELAVPDKIGVNRLGEEQLQCYIKNGSSVKAKYFASIDGSPFTEISKNDVAQYLTPAIAAKLTQDKNETEVSDEVKGQDVLRLKLSGIYMIGNLGSSVM